MSPRRAAVEVEPIGSKPEPELPADYRCDEDPPERRLVSEVIAFLEKDGGPEPSAIKRHLREYRAICYERHKLSGPGTENLLATVQRLDAQIKTANVKVARYRQLQLPVPEALKLELAGLEDEREMKAHARVERKAKNADLNTRRMKKHGELYHSMNGGLSRMKKRNAEELAIRMHQHRGLYVSFPEDIPADVLEIVRDDRIVDGFASQLGQLTGEMRADSISITEGLDLELEIALHKRANTKVGLWVGSRMPRPVAPPSSLEDTIGS